MTVSRPNGFQKDFDLSQSKWHGKFTNKTLRIAMCLVNDDGNLVSFALSSIAAFIKKHNSDIEVKLFYIIRVSNEEKYLPAGFASYVKNWNPDVFAISVFSNFWEETKPYLAEIKRIMPEILILAGGYQAITRSDETISFPAIDFVCDGDGEIPASNLINYLQGKTDLPVNGMWEKLKDGTIYKTPKFHLHDLSTVPFPDYEIYESGGNLKISYMSAHLRSKRILPVMTGRGCLYNCTYCGNANLRKIWSDKKTFMRKYDAGCYVDELVRLRDKYGINYFEFWDELFFGNLPWVIKFFDLYQKKLTIPFAVGSRVDVMNSDLCKKAADAGCDVIYFGIESGNENYRRKYLNRFDKNRQIIEAAENCRKAGIKRGTWNMIGMPFETKAQMLDTLELNKKINPEFLMISTFIPFKGMKLFEIAEKAGLLFDSLRTLNFRQVMHEGVPKMNIKQAGGSATEEEFTFVYRQMVDFRNSLQPAQTNN